MSVAGIPQSIGPYEVLREIGRGGMGVVYLARDSKLERDAAIKALPADVTQDDERLSRFEREARLLATLHHPNIAAVYGLEEVEGARYLALEYVEGEDLSVILSRGAIPVDEALSIARQIAEAIEAAHAKGVIHRDLKPGNVKITPDGTAKVLDFGLAKTMVDDPGTASGLISSPTVVTLNSPTVPGVILGTAGYISPEQARAKVVDRRTDVWSFGCILYEMLTGQQIFGGETATDSLGAIMHKQPDWSVLPPETPPAVRLLLRRCLAKDRQRRLQDMGDARLELEEAIADPTGSSLGLAVGAPQAASARGPVWRAALPWAIVGALGVALVGTWLNLRAGAEQLRPVRKLTLTIPEDRGLLPFAFRHMAVSPDGSRLVFIGRSTPWSQLYMRPLDQLVEVPIPNSDGAWGTFFSPDSQWIAYCNDDKLMKMSVQGSPPSTLCDAPGFRGGTWCDDGTIVFAPENNGGLSRVLAVGGTPEPLTTITTEDGDESMSHRLPHALPGGRGVIFTAAKQGGEWDEVAIMVCSFETGEVKQLVTGGCDGRYVPTGHLLYYRENTIMAAPFDTETLEVTGPSVPVLEGVAGGNARQAAQLALSDEGTLAYLSGTESEERSLVWTDDHGNMEPLSELKRKYRGQALSPGNDRVAVVIDDDADLDLWILERDRDILRPLTFDDADDEDPVWSPDGDWIMFSSERHKGEPNLYRVRADFTGTPERLTTSDNEQVPCSWSPDGTMLLYMEIHPETEGDIYLLRFDEAGRVTGEPELVTNRPHWEWGPRFSPDGEWIVHGSAESGRAEIYVRSVSGRGAPVQVSTEGGWAAGWSPVGNTLFYATQGEMMSVKYSVQDGVFVPEMPTELFSIAERFFWWDFDVAGDGRRFSKMAVDNDDGSNNPTIVLNWFEELKRKTSSVGG
jgi:serine/threonine-protein kinase